jgi:hypothetical protein
MKEAFISSSVITNMRDKKRDPKKYAGTFWDLRDYGNKTILVQSENILTQYAAQGLRLTLRQLYYQLVSSDIIPNREEEYSNLSELIVKGRMTGFIDWSAIEDRLRNPERPWQTSDINSALYTIINQYRLDRQKNQPNHIEVWVEKDALSNIVSQITDKYGIYHMVNRGYSSASAVYRSYHRFLHEIDDNEKEVKLLYIGDHDPSGLDMIRDIQDRLHEFGIPHGYFHIDHIALTRDQIDEYDPPPNPAKITDPRADWYIDEHGEESWEVDALEPQVMLDLIDEKINELLDIDLYNEVLDKEQEDLEKLNSILDNQENE